MKAIEIQYYKLSFTEFIIASFEGQLCMLDYRYRAKRESVDRRVTTHLNATFVERSSEVIEACKKQLDEYLNGERKVFDLPLLLVGSPFQKSVWEALQTIPYGQTSSYLELAKAIGNPKAVRAVANANGANSIAIIIPCHRVIGSDGSLTGYAGGLPKKQKLLELEGSLFK